MSGSADPHVPLVDEAGDGDAATRLTARLAELDLDAPTLELLLAALAADECDPYSMGS